MVRVSGGSLARRERTRFPALRSRVWAEARCGLKFNYRFTLPSPVAGAAMVASAGGCQHHYGVRAQAQCQRVCLGA
eukprot:12938076-Prorocentrum_lima.AAC.1